jgi:DnaJ-class molecular chaperone
MAARPHDRSASSGNRQARSSTDPNRENYYQLLNIPYSANPAQITRAYREAIKRSHPDRVRPEFRAQAEDICKDLNAAYKTLKDPVSRLAYDKRIRPQEIQDQLMRRYVSTGGMPGGGAPIDRHASNLRREAGPAETRDRRRSERSALWSLLSAFLVIALGLIGLILAFGLVSFVVQQLF